MSFSKDRTPRTVWNSPAKELVPSPSMHDDVRTITGVFKTFVVRRFHNNLTLWRSPSDASSRAMRVTKPLETANPFGARRNMAPQRQRLAAFHPKSKAGTGVPTSIQTTLDRRAVADPAAASI